MSLKVTQIKINIYIYHITINIYIFITEAISKLISTKLSKLTEILHF